MSANGDKGSDRIASLFFGKSKKNKIVSLDDEKKEKRKSRITYVQTVEDAKSLENQTTPLHPAIKEDVEKEKEKDKGITPPKAKENNPTVSKTKISNDASSSEHVDEETVKETEEVTILPPPPIKIETPIVDEVKQDDKLLELAIIKELTRVIKEDLAELEKLEYEMMVIHDKEEKEYDTKEIEKYSNPRGGRYQAGLYPVSANVPLGAQTGATPDGRLAYTPIADGVSPAAGRDSHGPTAACNSVSTLDHFIASNGTLYNMKFHPTALAGVNGLENFVALVQGYFDRKGSHMQFNVVSRETLRDAQKHPEKYSGLVVRVAGYSALFTTLSRSLQEDIINRTEQGGF